MEQEATTSVAEILSGGETTPAENTTETTQTTEPTIPEGYVALPTDKSTPEELSAFYGKLGRPEAAEQYEMAIPEGMDDSFPKAMAPIMFEAGLTQAQAAKLSEGWNGFISTKAAEMEKAYHEGQEKEMAELEKEWGADYAKNEEIARQAARKYGLDNDTLVRLERAMGSKALMNFMHKIGSTIMDAPIKAPNAGNSQPTAYTAAQAAAKLEELKADKEFGAKLIAHDKEAEKLFDSLCMAVAKGE